MPVIIDFEFQVIGVEAVQKAEVEFMFLTPVEFAGLGEQRLEFMASHGMPRIVTWSHLQVEATGNAAAKVQLSLVDDLMVVQPQLIAKNTVIVTPIEAMLPGDELGIRVFGTSD